MDTNRFSSRSNGFYSFALLVVTLLLVYAATASSAFGAGKKYGVFIGINEYEFGRPLVGAVKDAQDWQKVLVEKFGFSEADTVLLLDGAATRQGIIDSINRFGAKAGKGDILVVTYSGHGTLFPDRLSAEKDEVQLISYLSHYRDPETGAPMVELVRGIFDSALVPVDANKVTSGKPWKNLIIDDELYALFQPIWTKGAKVFFFSDSCHSGTIAKGEEKENGPRAKFVDPQVLLGGSYMKSLKEPSDQKTMNERTADGFYLVMSGAQDNQYSWDSDEGGLFTQSAVSILRSRGADASGLSYRSFYSLVSDETALRAFRMYQEVQEPNMESFSISPIFDEKIFLP